MEDNITILRISVNIQWLEFFKLECNFWIFFFGNMAVT